MNRVAADLCDRSVARGQDYLRVQSGVGAVHRIAISTAQQQQKQGNQASHRKNNNARLELMIVATMNSYPSHLITFSKTKEGFTRYRLHTTPGQISEQKGTSDQ